MSERYNWRGYDSEDIPQSNIEYFKIEEYEGHFNWWCNESENVELNV